MLTSKPSIPQQLQHRSLACREANLTPSAPALLVRPSRVRSNLRTSCLALFTLPSASATLCWSHWLQSSLTTLHSSLASSRALPSARLCSSYLRFSILWHETKNARRMRLTMQLWQLVKQLVDRMQRRPAEISPLSVSTFT